MSVTPSPTVVGVFRDRSVVGQAIEALYQAGFAQDQIRYSLPGNSSGGFLNDLKSLFTGANSTSSGDLANDLTAMGLSSEQARYYAHEYDNGNIVMAVHALDREQEVLSIFHQFGAYGIHNTRREATANVSEDAVDGQPTADTDTDRPTTPYARQSTDYEHQMAPYAQQPASSTWDGEPEQQQPAYEDSNSHHAVSDEPAATNDYTDNNTTYNDNNVTYNNDHATYTDNNAAYHDHDAGYTEQNSVIAPAGVADQQNLPDNIEPESVVDHQQNHPGNYAPVHKPAVSDEYLTSPDHQEQAAQDNTPAAAVEHRDYPTTVTYDEAPQAPAYEPATPADQHQDAADDSADNAASAYPGSTSYAHASTDYDTEPDLSIGQEHVSETNQAAPMSPSDQTTTTASQREEKLRLLQQRLQSAQQRLQDSKSQLQAAKEHETQLQSLKQQLEAIEAELEKNEAELRETHSRIEQYY